MGTSISWLIVRGKTRERILDDLALRISKSAPHPYSPILRGCELPDGWYLVAGGYEDPENQETVLKRLSVGCEVIAGGVEDHVMKSYCCNWKDGREIWWMRHDADVSREDLDVRGELPIAFNGIYEQLKAEQETMNASDASPVDCIICVPQMLTELLIGFDVEDEEPGGEWEFLVDRPVTKFAL